MMLIKNLIEQGTKEGLHNIEVVSVEKETRLVVTMIHSVASNYWEKESYNPS